MLVDRFYQQQQDYSRDSSLIGFSLAIGGKNWWEELVGRTGGKNWWEELVGRTGGKNWGRSDCYSW